MEDFILTEIDRLGRKLGLLDDGTPDYSLTDVKDEFGRSGCTIDLEMLLQQENPVWYLVEKEKLSDRGLETLMDILFHSDLDEARRNALLKDVLAYLDGKGCYSFRLHSLTVPKKD